MKYLTNDLRVSIRFFMGHRGHGPHAEKFICLVSGA
jgi:hypothetical protein